MATFKVNEGDSARVMLDKLNSYVLEVKKEKYNNVLKLLNELFEQKHKSLRNFTKIDCNHFESKSTSRVIKILDANKEKLGYDTQKLKDFYAEKKNKEKKPKDTEPTLKDITDETKITVANTKSKTKTKSGSVQEEFTVSKEVFSIITKLIKSLEYKLVKSTNFGKPCYSLIMCT
jgi:hypothetical protein